MGFLRYFRAGSKQQKMKHGLEKTRTGFFQCIVNTLTKPRSTMTCRHTGRQLILADVGPSLRRASGGRAAG